MDVNRTIRVYLTKEDIQRLLDYYTIEGNGFEIKYDKHYSDPDLKLVPYTEEEDE